MDWQPWLEGEYTTRVLNDLWHWNGDLQKPAWRSFESPTDVLWPPPWQAPEGWTSDAEALGELWLVGGSGKHFADVSMRTLTLAIQALPLRLALRGLVVIAS